MESTLTGAEPAKSDTAGLASPNFAHLAKVVPLLGLLGVKAERYVFDDPSTALFKLRQFGEVLAQQAAASTGLYVTSGDQQVDVLRRLRDARVIDFEVVDHFHALRKAGNIAVHEHAGTRRDALHAIRIAWKLGVWYQRAFKDRHIQSGAFVPPPDPRETDYALQAVVVMSTHDYDRLTAPPLWLKVLLLQAQLDDADLERVRDTGQKVDV